MSEGPLTEPTTVRCACGEELVIDDDDNRAACSACGRSAHFAIVGDRPRKVGPWIKPRHRREAPLPYRDE